MHTRNDGGSHGAESFLMDSVTCGSQTRSGQETIELSRAASKIWHAAIFVLPYWSYFQSSVTPFRFKGALCSLERTFNLGVVIYTLLMR